MDKLKDNSIVTFFSLYTDHNSFKQILCTIFCFASNQHHFQQLHLCGAPTPNRKTGFHAFVKQNMILCNMARPEQPSHGKPRL